MSITSISGPTDEIQEIHKEFQLIQHQIQQRNHRLACIEKHIPYLRQTEFLGSNAKDLTLV